jgi:beta-lactamase regulating signal transducer with metallopeptidase domain
MMPFLIVDALHRTFCGAGLGLAGAFQAFSNIAAPLAVAALWQGMGLAAAMVLALRVTPRVPAAHRFVLWSTAFAVLVVVPFLPLIDHRLASMGQGTLAVARSGPAQPWLSLDARWSLVIGGLWLLLSFVRAADLIAHSIRLRKLWKDARPIDPSPVAELAFPASTRRNCRICTTPDLDRPSVIGFLAPRILIPDWLFPRLTCGEVEQIVLHEYEHLRRCDDWTNLLQKLCLVLFPLNPALWFIERQLSKEREVACDESVVRITQAPRAYAACLASLAERGLERRAESLSLGAWQRRPELVDRVHRILRRGRLLEPATSRVVLGGFACALLVAAVELARCPELVAFVGKPAPQALAATQLGDALYPAIPARRDAQSSYYAVPAKAVIPAPRFPEPPVYRARAIDARQNGGAVGELRAASTEPGQTAVAKALHRPPRAARSHAEAGEQLIVFTAWEQVDTPAPNAQTVADYDTEPANKATPAPVDSNNATTRHITVTRLVFKVVPQASASDPRPGSGAHSEPAQPAAIPFGDGWLVIQL